MSPPSRRQQLLTLLVAVTPRSLKSVGHALREFSPPRACFDSEFRVCNRQSHLRLPLFTSLAGASHDQYVEAAAVVRKLRGGDEPRKRPRERARRSLTAFIPPALVWLAAVGLDYTLWWKIVPNAIPAVDELWPTSDVVRGTASNRWHFVCFHMLLVLALTSHVAVMVADPGFLSAEALLVLDRKRWGPSVRWCDRCHATKPPRAHHCRRCGACVSRMDHHCIYAANCVGAGNHKQFLLLLLYSAACATHALVLLAQHPCQRGHPLCFSMYFRRKCRLPDILGTTKQDLAEIVIEGESLQFSGSRRVSIGVSGSTTLAGVVSVFLVWVVALLFVQCYGIAIDNGMIDRMQQRAVESANRRFNGGDQNSGNGSTSSVDIVRSLSSAEGSSAPPSDEHDNTFTSNLVTGAHRNSRSLQGARSAHTRLPNIDSFENKRSPTASQSNAYSGSGRAVVWSAFAKWWKVTREEILGEGSWFMWFVPAPAKLTADTAARMYCDPR